MQLDSKELHFGGIFREEVAQNLLDKCIAVIQGCFGSLHLACAQKVDGDDLFTQCADSVRNTWSEAEFQTECMHAGDAFEVFVRGSFISFVRQMNLDHTGQSRVEVRLTIPPTVAFMREFLRDLTEDPVFRGGQYFKSDRILQKDLLMKSIRASFGHLSKEYVYVSPSTSDETCDPLIEADDSVSCVSHHTPVAESSRDSPRHTQKQEITPTVIETDISVQLRNQPAETYIPKAESAASSTTAAPRSAATGRSYKSEVRSQDSAAKRKNRSSNEKSSHRSTTTSQANES